MSILPFFLPWLMDGYPSEMSTRQVIGFSYSTALFLWLVMHGDIFCIRTCHATVMCLPCILHVVVLARVQIDIDAYIDTLTLWTHAHTFYFYEQLQETQPPDLKISPVEESIASHWNSILPSWETQVSGQLQSRTLSCLRDAVCVKRTKKLAHRQTPFYFFVRFVSVSRYLWTKVSLALGPKRPDALRIILVIPGESATIPRWFW